MRGKLVTFEGPDGAGKTTARDYLFIYLKDRGFDVACTREPGGTPMAEEIREIVLRKREPGETWSNQAELLLFAAARAQHVERLIAPFLRDGTTVLCDRFSDSSYAYQGSGRGLTTEVLELERFVLKGFEPDYTLFFDVTQGRATERLGVRPAKTDRLDEETPEFKKRVRDGYYERARQNMHRMHWIDANGTIEEVEAQIRKWADCVFIPAMKQN